MKLEVKVSAGRQVLAQGWVDCSSLAMVATCDLDVSGTNVTLAKEDALTLTLRMVEGAEQPFVGSGQSTGNSYILFKAAHWVGGIAPAPPPRGAAFETPTDLAPYGGIPLFVNGDPRGCTVYELTLHFPDPKGGVCGTFASGPVPAPGLQEGWVWMTLEGLPAIQLTPKAHLHLVIADTPTNYPEPRMSVNLTVASDQRSVVAQGQGPCTFTRLPAACDIPLRVFAANLPAGTNLTATATLQDNLQQPIFSAWSNQGGYTMLVLENATYEPRTATSETTSSSSQPHAVPSVGAWALGVALMVAARRRQA